MAAKEIVVDPFEPFAKEFVIPPSKSHTMRALFLALMAKNVSYIENPLESPDTEAMLLALRTFGAKIIKEKTGIRVEGINKRPLLLKNSIHVGNSGLTLRFMMALAALVDREVLFYSDASLETNRPSHALVKGLKDLGAQVVSLKKEGFAPFSIKGPIRAGSFCIDGEDSQPVSALLLLLPFLEGSSCLQVENLGERPYVDMTLFWLSKFNLGYTREKDFFTITGSQTLEGFATAIGGDFSSSLFPLALALITKKDITLRNLDFSDVQGDKEVFYILEKMGAKFVYEKDKVEVLGSKSRLVGRIIDIKGCIDALPILSVIGAYAEGKTVLQSIEMAKKKESNRVLAMIEELRKMGATIYEENNLLVIEKSSLRGALLNSHQDHRVVLSLLVAAYGAKGKSIIQDAVWMDKTYGSFLEESVKVKR